MATLHFIDNWTGETAKVMLDGNVKWLRSISSSEHSIDVCGGSFKEAAFNVPVILETPHSGDFMKIAFKTNINDDPCVKSLGIDNVEIYVK